MVVLKEDFELYLLCHFEISYKSIFVLYFKVEYRDFEKVRYIRSYSVMYLSINR